MKYLSLCSGIEAATVAWAEFGWEAVAFAEIEPFPNAVLAHHYPDVPNLGDITRWREWPEALLAEVDIVAGGPPCQAFSLAGARESLADERGNLTLVYVHILDHIDQIRARHGRPPVICVYENVPGLLCTRDNAFGSFLAALAGECDPLRPPGTRWTYAGFVRGPRRAVAWRSFDAQHFQLAQRRLRVFVVASAREGFRPEEILFESQGMRRDSPPSRATGEGLAGTLTRSSLDGSSPCGGDGRDGLLVVGTVTAKWAKWAKGSGGPSGDECQNLIAVPSVCPACCGSLIEAGLAQAGSLCPCSDPILADPITTRPYQDRGTDEKNLVIAFNPQAGGNQTTLGFDPASYITGTLEANQVPAICFDTTQISSAANGSNPQPGDPCHTLSSEGHPPAIAFNLRGRDGGAMPEVDHDGIASMRAASGGSSRSYVAVGFTIHGTDGTTSIATESDLATCLRTKPPGSPENSTTTVVLDQWAVRRLTPRECERLQGFKDDYTLIPWRGKPAAECPDGPRYRGLGNSWAIPPARWIGRRIHEHLQKAV